MVPIEKDGWRAEPLPDDFPQETTAATVGAVCTYCELQGFRVFLRLEIDERMKPFWYCGKERHRFPHSDDLVWIAGVKFAQLLAGTLRSRRLA